MAHIMVIIIVLRNTELFKFIMSWCKYMYMNTIQYIRQSRYVYNIT